MLVDIIYIDPPYNTGNKDFIYNDSFVSNDDNHKHSKWLSFMKKRLMLAKELLKDDGVIFISIDDNEQAYLKVLMDEIFGEENFVSDLIWIRNPGGESDNLHIAKTKDFILMYARKKSNFKINLLKKEYDILDFKKDGDIYYKKGSMFEKSGENDRLIDRKNLGYVCYWNENNNDFIIKEDYDKNMINESLTINQIIYNFDQILIKNGYIPIIPRYNTYGRWRIGAKKMQENFDKGLIIFEKIKNNQIKMYEKVIFDNYVNLKPKDLISFTTNANGSKEFLKIFGNNIFSKPKPSLLIQYLINLVNKKDSLILDFFAGSGTTAQAVMELNQEDGGNRRFILITNNENNIATDVCYERIYRVINGKGSNNEPINWKYNDQIPSLINNHVKYLKILPIHKINGEFEDFIQMQQIYKDEFNVDNINIKDFEK